MILIFPESRAVPNINSTYSDTWSVNFQTAQNRRAVIQKLSANISDLNDLPDFLLSSVSGLRSFLKIISFQVKYLL
jgi:hypothetical protein